MPMVIRVTDLPDLVADIQFGLLVSADEHLHLSPLIHPTLYARILYFIDSALLLAACSISLFLVK